MNVYEGVDFVITSALDGGEWSAASSGPLYPRQAYPTCTEK